MDRIKERFRMGIEDVEMFAAIDQAQLDALTNALVAAKRIFVAGWGRAGNCVKILSMDCSQIGLTTYIVGDNSTPAIQPDDILVIGSGSGETKTMAILANQCKKHGATLGLISGNADSTIGKLADYNVVIPAKKWDPAAPPASGGSLYHVMVMTVDILRVYMAEALGVTNQNIHNNHNNLE